MAPRIPGSPCQCLFAQKLRQKVLIGSMDKFTNLRVGWGGTGRALRVVGVVCMLRVARNVVTRALTLKSRSN